MTDDAAGVAGLVVEVHGMLVTVLDPATGVRVRCRPPRDRTTPVIGDRVTIERQRPGSSEPPRVLAIAPRSRTYARPGPRGPAIVATHVDRLVIVSSVFPGPRPGLVDRMWSALDDAHVEVVLVLNKCDLEGAEAAARELDDFVAVGALVVLTSVRTGAGLAELGARLASGVTVLAGHSGVGKSSLLNALVPGAGLAVGAVHDPTGKGKHTTTVATVHAFGQGLLVDTPGVRAFPLEGLPLELVATRFPGFADAAERCHFAGCLHEGEPGCAVVDDAPPERLARWHALLAALREEAAAVRPSAPHAGSKAGTRSR